MDICQKLFADESSHDFHTHLNHFLTIYAIFLQSESDYSFKDKDGESSVCSSILESHPDDHENPRTKFDDKSETSSQYDSSEIEEWKELAFAIRHDFMLRLGSSFAS